MKKSKIIKANYKRPRILHSKKMKTLFFGSKGKYNLDDLIANKSKLGIQIFRYILLALLNYVIQLCAIKLCYEIYKINFYISTFIGVILTMATGYILMNYWVFLEKQVSK